MLIISFVGSQRTTRVYDDVNARNGASWNNPKRLNYTVQDYGSQSFIPPQSYNTIMYDYISKLMHKNREPNKTLWNENVNKFYYASSLSNNPAFHSLSSKQRIFYTPCTPSASKLAVMQQLYKHRGGRTQQSDSHWIYIWWRILYGPKNIATVVVWGNWTTLHYPVFLGNM